MSDALILCPPQRVGGLERRHPMDLIHRPNKTITQFLSLSHTVGVHLKNFFCREDSRLTPQNNQPDEPKHQQMEPFPHAHTCQSYFRSGRTARPTCAGSDAAFLVASAAFWESRFPAPQLFHSSPQYLNGHDKVWNTFTSNRAIGCDHLPARCSETFRYCSYSS